MSDHVPKVFLAMFGIVGVMLQGHDVPVGMPCSARAQAPWVLDAGNMFLPCDVELYNLIVLHTLHLVTQVRRHVFGDLSCCEWLRKICDTFCIEVDAPMFAVEWISLGASMPGLFFEPIGVVKRARGVAQGVALAQSKLVPCAMGI